MSTQSPRAHSSGILALLASIVLCAAAHLILRHGALGASGRPLLRLIFDPHVVLGLGVYAAGTLLWLCCLSKIDLSLAFPGSALQLILVLSGASWLLGEKISTLQIIGTAIILGGLSLLFLDRGGRHA